MNTETKERHQRALREARLFRQIADLLDAERRWDVLDGIDEIALDAAREAVDDAVVALTVRVGGHTDDTPQAADDILARVHHLADTFVLWLAEEYTVREPVAVA